MVMLKFRLMLVIDVPVISKLRWLNVPTLNGVLIGASNGVRAGLQLYPLWEPAKGIPHRAVLGSHGIVDGGSKGWQRVLPGPVHRTDGDRPDNWRQPDGQTKNEQSNSETLCSSFPTQIMSHIFHLLPFLSDFISDLKITLSFSSFLQKFFILFLGSFIR